MDNIYKGLEDVDFIVDKVLRIYDPIMPHILIEIKDFIILDGIIYCNSEWSNCILRLKIVDGDKLYHEATDSIVGELV